LNILKSYLHTLFKKKSNDDCICKNKNGDLRYKSIYNKKLLKFKNIHKEKSAILFATGPSIKKYKPFKQSEDCIKIGVNRIYNYPSILNELDYFFFGSHYYLDKEHKQNLNKICKKHNCKKFSASYENGLSHYKINRGNIGPEDALKIGAIPFENNLQYFSEDIANFALLGHSIVFPPLQFILYTGISKLYLVGCDGGWTAGPVQSGDQRLLGLWNDFKIFKETYYKKVKICSINPVSLKGWFEDEFS